MREGMERQADLAQIANAFHALSPGLCLDERRKQQGREDGNDRDDAEQFDQGEAGQVYVKGSKTLPPPLGAVPGTRDCTLPPWRPEGRKLHKLRGGL